MERKDKADLARAFEKLAQLIRHGHPASQNPAATSSPKQTKNAA